MHDSLISALATAPVIPLLQAGDPETAVAVAGALAEGGMTVIEVVQRTDAAPECLTAVARAWPGLLVGAGTVLSETQARQCLERGARFIVSPGLDEAIVGTARDAGVDALPGILTPSEALRALRLGLEVVKFFPAATAGGARALAAIAAALPPLRFVPTGGITAAGLADYLRLPAVLAVGGSWLTPSDAMKAKDFNRITTLSREALSLADRIRTGILAP